MSKLILENPLREFVERLYAAPNVAETAIALQDQYGLDVNVLLSMSWLGIQGYQVSLDELLALDDLLNEVRETVIKPIRQSRREAALVDKQSALYSELKASELAAEYQHLAICYRFFARKELAAGSVELVLANNQRYLGEFSLLEDDYQEWLALIALNVK